MYIDHKKKQKLINNGQFTPVSDALPENGTQVEFIPKHYLEHIFGTFRNDAFYTTIHDETMQEKYPALLDVECWKVPDLVE